MPKVESGVNLNQYEEAENSDDKIQVYSKPLVVVNAQQETKESLKNAIFLPGTERQTIVIGVGLEKPSAFSIEDGGLSQIDSQSRHRWDMYIGKPFDFTIRSTIVLYDKYGFVIKGGSLKKRNEVNTFEYERRRLNIDTYRIKLSNEMGKWYVEPVASGAPCTDTEEPKDNFATNIRRTLMLSKPIITAQKDTLFTKDNSNHSDIEQLKIKIKNSQEIHHMVVMLHYDAPQSHFLSNRIMKQLKCTRLMLLHKLIPHLKPYIRVVDGNTGVELLRYYPKKLPQLSCCLELSRTAFISKYPIYRNEEIGYEYYDDGPGEASPDSEENISEYQAKPLDTPFFREKVDPMIHVSPQKVRNSSEYIDVVNFLDLKIEAFRRKDKVFVINRVGEVMQASENAVVDRLPIRAKVCRPKVKYINSKLHVATMPIDGVVRTIFFDITGFVETRCAEDIKHENPNSPNMTKITHEEFPEENPILFYVNDDDRMVMIKHKNDSYFQYIPVIFDPEAEESEDLLSPTLQTTTEQQDMEGSFQLNVPNAHTEEILTPSINIQTGTTPSEGVSPKNINLDQMNDNDSVSSVVTPHAQFKPSFLTHDKNLLQEEEFVEVEGEFLSTDTATSDEDDTEEYAEEDNPEDKRFCWSVHPILQGWRYRPSRAFNENSNSLLSSFLYNADLNSFGTGLIPKLPKEWTITIHHGNFPPSRKPSFYYCVVGANSIFHTSKQSTKASSSGQWEETYIFSVNRNYRAAAIFLEVYEKTPILRNDVLYGRGMFRFGDIELDNEDPLRPIACTTTLVPIFRKKQQRGDVKITVSLNFSNDAIQYNA
eukprot:CAMPEP_0117428368 /NCGR_PEP_ID=MMETSP0758-20121206/8097_1 /TAXON_ID=63605 /ORGANISM="Percolomonas cosmopolitus, Strain AE-1 (ATCC 50343)" /LENGTH=820 /DNA_ID=CAMNT_0005214697 /DNA_START=249 /DNA_END=2708 /DNA_ORIENTATION=+